MTRWLCCALVLLLVAPVHAVIFHDAIGDTKRTLEFLWMQAQELRKYVEMVTTATQMVEQVKGTYQILDYAAKNLQDMVKDGDVLGLLSTVEYQTTAMLNQAQYVGFNLDRASRQFEALYGNTAALTTPAGRMHRYQQMRAARMEMAGIAVQTQSIRQTFTDIYERLTVLLGISSLASGQKALQQLQVQQQALAQKQQQLGLSMQAVSARLMVMEQAEKMVLEQMQADQRAHEAEVWYGGTAGLRVPPGFAGFMMSPAHGGR